MPATRGSIHAEVVELHEYGVGGVNVVSEAAFDQVVVEAPWVALTRKQ
ncbi:unannotated protein [freshwater metagenome]|uniref:Unannotated protein n=1 Tax=freshwater metagenome TaxID=449393 RepID=A0A6J7NII1_9ZZZZ